MMGSETPHIRSKLSQLHAAGAKGVRCSDWSQSKIAMPKLVARGFVKVVQRSELVDYYVLTEAGQKLLEPVFMPADAIDFDVPVTRKKEGK